MVNFIAALCLLVGGIKLAGPWSKFIQHENVLFASPLQEENSKSQGCEEKEKIEEEQVCFESGSVLSIYHSGLVNFPFDAHGYIPCRYDEPPCPPPDITSK